MKEKEIKSAIILGTVGEDPDKLFVQFPGMKLSERRGPVKTPYASIYYYVAYGCGLSFYVVERHNCTGSLMYPHQLGMTAAAVMYFLTQVRKVEVVVSIGAVGGANGNNFEEGELKPGSIVVPETFLDLSGTVTTFAEGANVKVNKLAGAHCPAGNDTICTHLRNTLMTHKLVGDAKIILNRGLLSCVSGPRLETEAEKKLLFEMGADLFGMHTTERDWVLSHELSGVHFLPLLHVTNMVFEGHGDTGFDVDRQARENFIDVMSVFFRVLRAVGNDKMQCFCGKRPSIFDCITTHLN